MKLDYGWKNPEHFRRWGPYTSFGNHASTEMIISWQSKFYSMKRWIYYGETKECEKKIQEKCDPSFHHTFWLKDLKPNTKYYYKISRPEDLKIEEQPVYSFKTGPKEGEKVDFEFCISGDMHADDGNAKKTFDSMEENSPEADFLVTVGDCVTHGGIEEKWNDYFFQADSLKKKIPFMNTTGNHDSDHPESYAHFIQTFQHPYHNTEKGAFYYFVYGNAVFIMLDSDNAGQKHAIQGVVSDEQMEWLEEILDKYGLRDYWVFIFMHHQVYSTGDSGMMHMYDLAYRYLFEKYHVDGVFFGHDHHFEVFWTARESDWGGTHYCLVGNGGGGIDTFNINPKGKGHQPNYLWKGRTYIYERDGILDGNVDGGVRNDKLIEKAHVYGIMEHGYTNMKIKGNSCKMRMIGWQNQEFFVDTIKRTDTGKKYHTPKHMQEF